MQTILEMRRAQRDLANQARELHDQLTDDVTDKRAREIEGEFDDLMAEHDRIGRKIRAAEADELLNLPQGYWARGEDTHASGVGVVAGSEKRALADYLRSPKSHAAQAAMESISEARAASGLTDAAGGYVVPEIISGPILSRARDTNPLRDVVRVVTVSSGDVVFPLSNADATAGWVGETDTRSATTEPTFAGKVPTFGTNYAYVSMSEELAADSVVDIVDWFVTEAGAAIGEAEMTAIISGNGTKKPSGMLNVAPESGADGSRTANAFRYLEAAGTAAVTADEMLNLIYDLKARYRANGRWLMNSATTGAVRKLKDGDGNFLWQQNMIEGQPAMLAGYPVTICEAMENLGAGNHPIAFGDFQSAYILAQTGGMMVQAADRSITTPGMNKVYIRQRVGGCVYDEDAVRFLKNAAS